MLMPMNGLSSTKASRVLRIDPKRRLHREIELPIIGPTCVKCAGSNDAKLFVTYQESFLREEQMHNSLTPSASLWLTIWASRPSRSSFLQRKRWLKTVRKPNARPRERLLLASSSSLFSAIVNTEPTTSASKIIKSFLNMETFWRGLWSSKASPDRGKRPAGKGIYRISASPLACSAARNSLGVYTHPSWWDFVLKRKIENPSIYIYCSWNSTSINANNLPGISTNDQLESGETFQRQIWSCFHRRRLWILSYWWVLKHQWCKHCCQKARQATDSQ